MPYVYVQSEGTNGSKGNGSPSSRLIEEGNSMYGIYISDGIKADSIG